MFTGALNRLNNIREPTRHISARRIDAEAQRHVCAITKAAGSSFYWAMRFLPRERRWAMFAIYAFCRAVDDIADGPDSRDEKLSRLREWRAEINRLYDSVPTALTARALREPVQQFGLQREDFLTVIDGVEMDAVGDITGPSLNDLELYCRRVAGAVGLLSIRAFGATHPKAEQFAIALGSALQLTNILRDIHQDAAVGRVYLPHEFLDRHGVTTRDPSEVLAHRALPLVCDDVAQMAEQHFREAESALAQYRDIALRPAVVMMVNYQRILARLVATRWQSPERRIGISGAAKLWIALRYGVLFGWNGGHETKKVA